MGGASRLAAMSWVVVSLAGLPGAQDIPTIRVPVRLVTVPALVFSADDRLVPDLLPANFRVLDNGRPQAIRLDAISREVSVAVVVQINQDVCQYLPFIAKVGNAIEDLLAGASGDVAVIAYGDEVSVLKPFGTGETAAVLRTIVPTGRSARMIDAGALAAKMLAERPPARDRILVFVGQPADIGSETPPGVLRQYVERGNITVFGLSLPLLGKAFVSDNFSLEGVSQAEKGGFRGGVNLAKLAGVLSRGAESAAQGDPLTVLTHASGGTVLHFRTQRQLEDCISAIGVQVRSAYLVSFYAGSAEPGYHSVQVGVDVPGAKVYSRPGYWVD